VSPPPNLITLKGKVSANQRSVRNKHSGLVVWLTGLSGSGKSTIAIDAEKALFERGFYVVRLDGDHLRQGLCADLGFSPQDRAENIRRAGEVARLFYENGAVVLASFISPTRQMRAGVRQRLPRGAFIEVYVCASLETCMARDPKGFYARALRGEISSYTGIDSLFEEPRCPDMVLDTDRQDVGECVNQLMDLIDELDVLGR